MFSREANIILHSSKVNISEEDKEIILRNISYDLDWGEFLYISGHHRVIPLVMKTFQELKLINYIENHVRKIMQSVCNSIKQHNEVIYNEICNINKNFLNNSIKAILLKGGILAPFIYNDISLREFGDIDYLVNINDIPKIIDILLDMGYIQGHYDVNNYKIIPVTKQEKILHRMNSHEIVEFLKLNDNINCPLFMVDINFSIFWNAHNKNKNKHLLETKYIFDNSRLVNLNDSKIFYMSTQDQLIQLCAHLYNEAVYFCWHSNWIRDKSDLNLIKFCDISSFLINS